MKELTIVEENGLRFAEGAPGEPFMAGVRDAARIVEACLSNRVKSVLFYPENVTARFFDVSSTEAGEILEKLRSFRVRLAIVCPPGAVALSSRFPDLVAEGRRAGYFSLFDTRAAAIDWLAAVQA